MQVVVIVEAIISTTLKAARRFAAVLSVDTKRRKADCQKSGRSPPTSRTLIWELELRESYRLKTWRRELRFPDCI